MLWAKLRNIKLFRTLRFRLASTFLALLALVLAGVGVIGTTTLRSLLATQSEQVLREELGAMRGYLHFDGEGKPYWFEDPSDPEEQATVGRLMTVFVIANEDGEPWRGSPDPALRGLYDQKEIRRELQIIETSKEPYLKTFIAADKVPYQIISGAMVDDTGAKWYVAEGRSLAGDESLIRRFRRNYLIFFPIALFACALVSWYSAGKALRALQSVETAAQEITGSNLGLQIPKRGADDELDRLIGSFNQMSRRLKFSFEQIRRFSTDVSHELRTPLTAIQGQLEVALFTATRKEQLQEAIENALQDVERLSNLVRALLLLSQSETGQIPMNKAMVDMQRLVEDLVDQFQIPAEAHNVHLSHTTRGPVLCDVDRTQIERVVTNLLSNAIKYTPDGGWVRACAEQTGNMVRLIVEDSGVGIPKDHLPHIFDRFYRVPDPNPEKGLGLGLSFVSAIVRAHGGEIHVESEPGKGSRFEVVLPGAVRAPSEAPVQV
ncbi:MAG: HAMP domain-containing protein [Acidobacteriaceae bacterium]|nr:HAMP domain-containing protein [Acidobacteriaceae bacterium]